MQHGYDPGRIAEIQITSEPTFTTESGYMLLHADPTKAIKSPYQMVTINYFPTSVQRLYRIGTTGEWQNYQGQSIRVNQGEMIYAKGIDQYGNETRIISSYTVNVTDAIGQAAYDGNETTYFNISQTNTYMRVDSSMEGKRIRVYWSGGNRYVGGSNIAQTSTIYFLNTNKEVISSVTCSGKDYVSQIYTVPSGTAWIQTNMQHGYDPGRIAEIQVYNE